MANPTFLQTATAASDASAGTSHAITLGSAVRAAGGTTSPSTLILQISYDGNTGSLVSGITDSSGNTWQVCTDGTNTCKFSNGAGVNGEMWYALNCVGGVTPTITVTTSSSVKAKLAVAEVDQIRPISAIDRCVGRINTPSVATTSRTAAILTGGGGYTTKRRGMIEVIIAGTSWNDARTSAANATNFTGTFSLQGGSSNLGVGMSRSSLERTYLTAQHTVGRFTMSSSTTNPNAVMSCAFYRDGVVTTTDEDGLINNIETVVTVDTTGSGPMAAIWGGIGVWKSSSSAPLGNTGGSETDKLYGFFADYSSYLLSGVTLGSTFTWNVYTIPGLSNNDGTGWMDLFVYMYKDGTFGSTLTAGDDTVPTLPPSPIYANDLAGMLVDGWHAVTVDTATNYNTSGYTTVAAQMEGDTGGASSGTWWVAGDYSYNAVPQYLVLTLNYPVTATRRQRFTRLANSPRLTVQRVRR